MNLQRPLTAPPNAAARSFGSRLLNNPVLLERGLGVLLWTGLILVLVAKPF